MKNQVPHFRGGFGITPNEGSAISAFYSATCALVVWLGSGTNSSSQSDTYLFYTRRRNVTCHIFRQQAWRIASVCNMMCTKLRQAPLSCHNYPSSHTKLV